jgi:hypothetical protein
MNTTELCENNLIDPKKQSEGYKDCKVKCLCKAVKIKKEFKRPKQKDLNKIENCMLEKSIEYYKEMESPFTPQVGNYICNI